MKLVDNPARSGRLTITPAPGTFPATGARVNTRSTKQTFDKPVTMAGVLVSLVSSKALKVSKAKGPQARLSPSDW